MLDALPKHEWIVMEALWEDHPMFLSEIMDSLRHKLPWKRTTYLSYLKRMYEKGYVDFNEIRGNRSYFPRITRAECVQSESRHMITKMTDDSAKLFLTCMIQDSGLTEKEGAELKRLIDTLTAVTDEKEGP